MSERQVREAVEGELGGPISDAQWREFVDEGRVGDVEVGGSTPSDLADTVRGRRETWRNNAAPRVPDGSDWADIVRDVAGDKHTAALEVIAHRRANGWEDVQQLRTQYLPGGLLDSPEDVETWIEVETRSVGDRVNYPAQAISYRKRVAWGGNKDDIRWQEWEKLVPGDHPLAALGRLADRLATAYSWSRSRAVAFILIDEMPWVRRLELRTDSRLPSAFDRVTLTIDPTVDPAKVAAAYRAWRREYWGGKQYKPLSPKHYRLAAFWELNTEPNTAAMRRWNAEHGDEHWTYSNPRNFARDGRVALQRVLYPDLKPRSPKEDHQ